MSEIIKLNYRYRLWPTAAQEAALSESMGVARRFWNALVSLRRHALDLIRRGREADVRKRVIAERLAKGNDGGRARKLAELAARGKDVEAEETKSVWKLGRGVLAQEYAISLANAARSRKTGTLLGSALPQVADAFGLACKALRPGQRLRFRRREDSAPLRFQFQGKKVPIRDREDGVSFVDLGRLLPGSCREALRWMRFEQHRPLPASAKVVRVALTRDRLGWHVVFCLAVAAGEVAKVYPTTGRTAGVDPGRTTAFTIAPGDSPDYGQSDGFELSATRGQKRLLRRVARLARKADRQRRAANPECYAADGTIKRGRRPRKSSKNLEETLTAIARHHETFRARRKEFYSLAAGEILQRFDRVQIGNWTGVYPGSAPARKRNAKLIETLTGTKPAPQVPRAKGVRARERGQRRKDAANALGEFRRIISEKAARSTAPKVVVEVPEHGSTRSCPACGTDTGPRGIAQLGVRRWTCLACSKTFSRDRAAAYQLAVRSAEHAANAGGDGSPSRRPKARPQRAPRAVAGQREAATPPFPCAPPCERGGDDEHLRARSRDLSTSASGSRVSGLQERTRSATITTARIYGERYLREPA